MEGIGNGSSGEVCGMKGKGAITDYQGFSVVGPGREG
jgi:hypothetical protein